MIIPDGSPLARAIASGFTNGYETYDDTNGEMQLKMDMAANAAFALTAPIEADREHTLTRRWLFYRSEADNAPTKCLRDRAAGAADALLGLFLVMGFKLPTPITIDDERTKIINPYPITTPSYQIVVRELSEDES